MVWASHGLNSLEEEGPVMATGPKEKRGTPSKDSHVGNGFALRESKRALLWKQFSQGGNRPPYSSRPLQGGRRLKVGPFPSGATMPKMSSPTVRRAHLQNVDNRDSHSDVLRWRGTRAFHLGRTPCQHFGATQLGTLKGSRGLSLPWLQSSKGGGTLQALGTSKTPSGPL